jgi:hypothetical protein
MIKKRLYIVIGYLLITALFSVIIYNTESFTLTGFSIYSSQPDPTVGKDSYLRELSTTNYGTGTTLKIGTASTGGGREFRTILHFDTSPISSSNTVIQANLSAYLTTSATNNNITLNVYRLTSNWTETDASWYALNSSNNWTSAGGDYNSEIISSTIITNETGWVNISITTLARGWVNESYDNYGLMLYAPDAGVGDSKEFISSDYTDDTSLRPEITIDYTANAAPTIDEISSDSLQASPTQVGDDITFTINWTDLESDNAQTYVCNSSNITFASGCEDTTFCSTSLASTDPATCSYTTLIADNRTTSYWVAVCDGSNCSSVSSENFFYVNHVPAISLTQPDGGETVNQSQGNYSILFSVNDSDSDTLTANLYYGTTQNSTTNTIVSNLNLTTFCTDGDSDTATTNTCTYPWNSTGIYGTYYITINLNDSHTTTNDSSSSSFDVRSIIDDEAPQINSPTITSSLYSGQTAQINATITDDNTIQAWVDLNYTSTNITMTNTSTTEWNTTFTAASIGTYSYRIHANDTVGNLNNSMDWQEFTVVKPNATVITSLAPSTALPYSTIQITSEFNATNALENISAYLNVPAGFTFLGDYPQNSVMGDFTAGQIQNATWFISVPITEATYTINATFTDQYSNSWNGSNLQIEVTSAVGGGYTLAIAGYPEVETTEDYYVESKFKLNSDYASPDSMQVRIYDPTGSLIVGPASMTEESTGQYNYSYTIGASVTEGQWETIINATKSSTSYFSNHFWNVVGGPFDVRNITILNSSISNLEINVTTENTGGANKDLTLVWNLTREDTGEILDSGADTFMVSADSTRLWTVEPTTTYIGQVRITMLGHYSGTEKAGAYKIFSTTEAGAQTCGDGTCNGDENCATCSTDCGACAVVGDGGGGGGGGGGIIPEAVKESNLELIDFESLITATKNIEKTITIKLNNTGTTDLTNIVLELENLDEKYYTISPTLIQSLSSGKTNEFKITFIITDFVGEKNATLKIKTNELELTKQITINSISMRDYFINELGRLRERIINLKQKLTEDNEVSLIEDLKTCEDFLSALSNNIEQEEFIDAQYNIKNTDGCIDDIEDDYSQTKEIPFTGIKTNYWIWIITWGLIILLLIAIIIVIFLISKKLNILNFVKQKQTIAPEERPETARKRFINERLQKIKERLG